MTNSPCWHCKREWKCATCHIDCPDYVKWSKKNEYERDQRFAQREAVNGVYMQRTASVLKAIRKKGPIK